MFGRPPPVTRWWLRHLLPLEAREFVVGDLDEEFCRFIVSTHSPRRAARWYRSQALRTVWQTRGGPRRATDHSRSRGGTMESLWQDVRFTGRNLRRSPGFTLLIVITLGLGIGATTAIFSAVNEVLLRPLSFTEPDRLVMLWESNRERGWDQVHAAPANVLDWKERVSAFADVGMINDFTSGVALAGGDEPVQTTISTMSGNALSVLGVPPLLGRIFVDGDDLPDAPPVVVLSHRAWHRYFAADSNLVGTTIRLDGLAYEVVGVMGPDFRYTFNDSEMWTTLRYSATRRASIWFRQAHVIRAVARLRPGVSYAQAREELAQVARELQNEYPQLNRGMEAGLTPLQTFLVGDRATPLWLLLGAVALLQLIACANVANLLLVRSVARRRELAVRTALGAGRRRIMRQVFTESAVLALAGLVVGVGLGMAGLQWIGTLQAADLPQLAFTIDWRLTLFTVSVTGGSALLFGIMPAIRSAAQGVSAGLNSGSRTGADRQSASAVNGLVSVEIALAVVLVVGAGLLVRSINELRGVESGVDMEGVLTFELRPASGNYPSDRARAEFVFGYLERIEGLPGVARTGAVRRLPLTGSGWTSDFTIEGWLPDQAGTEVRHREATAGYFSTMEIPVLDGTMFRDRLGPDEAVPVVVNQAFAERYFPNGSPVGRRVAFTRAPTENSYWYPITAVVGNERMRAQQVPEPEIISNLLGDTPNTIRFAVKVEGNPLAALPAMRAALHEMDPEMPLVAARVMNQVAADALADDYFLRNLLGVFAACALLLAAVGVYGVSAQTARARTREIGIRVALGAPSRAIVGTLLSRGTLFVGLGLGLGLGGAAAGGRLMQGLLFGIQATDPATYLAVALLLGAVAVLASYLPARRATRVDPMTVLKAD